MQEQFFVQFDEPVDLNQVGLALREGGVSAPEVELLDSQRGGQYSPLLPPVRSKAAGVVQGILICAITTIFGLMAVVVDNAGYLLSLLAVAVVALRLRRKPASGASHVVRVRVDAPNAAAARSSLVRLGAAAILGPVA